MSFGKREYLDLPEPQIELPPPRKVRRSAVRRVFRALYRLVVLVALLAGGLAAYAYYEFAQPGPLTKSRVLEIEKGLSTPDIAAKLEAAGIIANAPIFTAAALVTRTRGRLKAGEYEFPPRASMAQVLNLLASGKVMVHKVSIPEGWTSDMALARIMEHPVLTGDIPGTPAEGAILPDTYIVKRGMKRQDVLDHMVARQTALLDEIWDKRNPAIAIKTKEEAVILASIVEKETGIASERPQIASVFMNRLNKGMRLQSDPTIIYGMVGGKGKLDRALTKADVNAPTPYNTYTINGLPPGPIANPGRASLEAVVNPAATDYLYFVADGTGGHVFATTLVEHNRNVAKWRKIEDAASQAQAPSP